MDHDPDTAEERVRPCASHSRRWRSRNDFRCLLPKRSGAFTSPSMALGFRSMAPSPHTSMPVAASADSNHVRRRRRRR